MSVRAVFVEAAYQSTNNKATIVFTAYTNQDTLQGSLQTLVPDKNVDRQAAVIDAMRRIVRHYDEEKKDGSARIVGVDYAVGYDGERHD